MQINIKIFTTLSICAILLALGTHYALSNPTKISKTNESINLSTPKNQTDPKKTTNQKKTKKNEESIPNTKTEKTQKENVKENTQSTLEETKQNKKSNKESIENNDTKDSKQNKNDTSSEQSLHPQKTKVNPNPKKTGKDKIAEANQFIEQGKIEIKAGRIDKALQLFHRAWKWKNDDWQLAWRIAHIYEMQNIFKLALEWYQKVLQFHPGQSHALYFVAQQTRQKKLLEAALNALIKAENSNVLNEFEPMDGLTITEKKIEIHYFLWQANQNGNSLNALHHLRQAAEMHYPPALWDLALYYEKQKKWQEAHYYVNQLTQLRKELNNKKNITTNPTLPQTEVNNQYNHLVKFSLPVLYQKMIHLCDFLKKKEESAQWHQQLLTTEDVSEEDKFKSIQFLARYFSEQKKHEKALEFFEQWEKIVLIDKPADLFPFIYAQKFSLSQKRKKKPNGNYNQEIKYIASLYERWASQTNKTTIALKELGKFYIENKLEDSAYQSYMTLFRQNKLTLDELDFLQKYAAKKQMFDELWEFLQTAYQQIEKQYLNEKNSKKKKHFLKLKINKIIEITDFLNDRADEYRFNQNNPSKALELHNAALRYLSFVDKNSNFIENLSLNKKDAIINDLQTSVSEKREIHLQKIKFIHLEPANHAYLKKNFLLAEKQLRIFLQKYPNDKKAIEMLGDSLWQISQELGEKKEYRASLPFLRRLSKENWVPAKLQEDAQIKWQENLYILALTGRKQNRWLEVIAYGTEWLKLIKNNPDKRNSDEQNKKQTEIELAIAEAYHAKREITQERFFLIAILNREPSERRALEALIALYRTSIHDPASLKKYLTQMIHNHPDHPRAAEYRRLLQMIGSKGRSVPVSRMGTDPNSDPNYLPTR